MVGGKIFKNKELDVVSIFILYRLRLDHNELSLGQLQGQMSHCGCGNHFGGKKNTGWVSDRFGITNKSKILARVRSLLQTT